jgi:hypothetical protein
VNTIPVVATDGNGNRRTNNYQVTVTGGATRGEGSVPRIDAI